MNVDAEIDEAIEMSGKFIYLKVNLDGDRTEELAEQFGVKDSPTILQVKKGKV